MWIQKGSMHTALFVIYAGILKESLLTDLSKAFDCISHDLLIAKLHAYSFSRKSPHLVYDYLRERKQRTKIGTTFSSWREIIYGVPQGSILGLQRSNDRNK